MKATAAAAAVVLVGSSGGATAEIVRPYHISSIKSIQHGQVDRQNNHRRPLSLMRRPGTRHFYTQTLYSLDSCLLSGELSHHQHRRSSLRVIIIISVSHRKRVILESLVSDCRFIAGNEAYLLATNKTHTHAHTLLQWCSSQQQHSSTLRTILQYDSDRCLSVSVRRTAAAAYRFRCVATNQFTHTHTLLARASQQE